MLEMDTDSKHNCYGKV